MRFTSYYLPRMVYEVLCHFQYGSINFMILSNKIVGLITGKLQCQSLESFNLTSVSSAKSPVIHATLTLIREVPEGTIVVMPGTGFVRYAQTYARWWTERSQRTWERIPCPKSLNCDNGNLSKKRTGICCNHPKIYENLIVQFVHLEAGYTIVLQLPA